MACTELGDDLVFDGAGPPLRVRGGAPLASGVALLMPGWTGAVTPRGQESAVEPQAVVSREGPGFRVTSGAEGDAGEAFATAQDAAFSVVNRVLTAMLAQSEARCSLHAAGVLGLAGAADGAVLLFGDTHAGKSTLALLCASAGRPILGDDVIVLDLEGDEAATAASPGLAPKVRLPVPAAVAARAGAYLRARRVAEIGRVAYLHTRVGEIAAAGRPYPVRGLVHLERLPTGAAEGPPPAQILPISRAQAIPALLRNCYAPHLTSTQRVRAMAAATARASCHRLRFTDSVAAFGLIESHFG